MWRDKREQVVLIYTKTWLFLIYTSTHHCLCACVCECACTSHAHPHTHTHTHKSDSSRVFRCKAGLGQESELVLSQDMSESKTSAK